MAYVVTGYVAEGYIGKPGSRVSFSLDGDTLTFEIDPIRPELNLSFVQTVLSSTGQEYIGCHCYTIDDIITLQFPFITQWDRDRLLLWWRDRARGMARQFIYTDIDGAETAVRFNSPKLPEMREIIPGHYSVTVSLRVC